MKRLEAAGAQLEGDLSNLFRSGDRYAMVRDPWGITLQLGQPRRTNGLIRGLRVCFVAL